MPVFLAICDIVADRSPCSATSAAVVSRIASRTAARCASIVSFHRFGTTPVYTTSLVRQFVFTKTYCLDKLLLSSITHDWKDTRMAGSPPYPHPHHGSTAPIGPEDLYTSQPAWDIGRPQPAFLALADAGAIRGRVLDVGCGTGEHVLLCAARGLDASGIDLAPTALAAAGAKADRRHLTARFLRYDALRLADLAESFDTVLDCGLFHTVDEADRATFVAGLRTALVPGGHYVML